MTKILLVTMLTLFSLYSYAQPVQEELDDGRYKGNFCSSCHGTNGNAVDQAIPSIGGQHKEYLKQSMIEMKNGERYSTLMKVFLKGYSDKEIENMALWYSTQEWKKTSEKNNQVLIDKAKISENLETCVSCHGANGNNTDDTQIPRIDGQPALYLYNAMMEYKNNKRNINGRAGEMDIVKDINDEELKTISEYFSSIK